MKKNIVRLTENKLRRIVNESVKKVLSEGGYYSEGDEYNRLGVWDLVEELNQTLGAENVVARLISRMGPDMAVRILNDIKSVEMGNADAAMSEEDMINSVNIEELIQNGKTDIGDLTIFRVSNPNDAILELSVYDANTNKEGKARVTLTGENEDDYYYAVQQALRNLE
jgi:hypothetical protein